MPGARKEELERGFTKEYEDNFRGNGYVYYIGFNDVYAYSNVPKF